MLLAAACRARQIPARVAVGLIHDPQQQVFVFHMWTEAWLEDAWRPIDATVENALPSANRIKLSDTNLAGESDYSLVTPVLNTAGRLVVELSRN